MRKSYISIHEKASQPLIWLINPLQRIKLYASNIGFARLIGKKTSITPLALPYLAALTPPRFSVRIIDEEVESLPEDTLPSLVGITALSTNVDRAWEIAAFYRAKKIPVVMGGPYVSVCTEEALGHADCVVIGEAESVWPTLLDDFERGDLKKTYKAGSMADFSGAPAPRWDLVNTRAMAAIPVQVSRGCPYNCEFCLVSQLFGHRMRYRAIDNVVAEVTSLPMKTVFFVDDNLTANKEYARELMARLKPLRIQWFCMASIEISRFPDLLQTMAESGCMHIRIGFESLNPESLAETGKRHNRAAEYAEAVERIHRAGITVNASLIAGFDHDTLDEYDRLHGFLRATNIWYPNVNILDVIPGSRLHARIVAEGRWYDRPSQLSGGLFPVMHYRRVSQTALFERNFAFLRMIFSWEDLYGRVIGLFSTGWFAKPRPNPDVPVLTKIVMTFKLLWSFLIVASPAKRRVFLALCGLIGKKKVDPEKVVFFLLTAEGVNRLLTEYEPHYDEWKKQIQAFDKGPWDEMTRPG